ncbi:MAG TPA: hypothetical protein VGN17_01885 [Bryobacteraceae bacterium]|jgi:hypothetical protein
MSTSYSKAEIDGQIAVIEKHQKSRSPKRWRFLRRLCDAEIAGKFQDADSAQGAEGCRALAREIYKDIHGSEKFDEQAPDALLKGLLQGLKQHYDPAGITIHGDEDKLLIEVKRDTFRPSFHPTPTAGAGGARSTDALSPFQRELHRYHLTMDDQGSFWTYTIIDFNQRVNDDRGMSSNQRAAWASAPFLRGTAPFLREIPPEDDRARLDLEIRHLYEFEARLFGQHLILLVRRPDSTSDVAVEFFPAAESSKERHYGARINQTWKDTTAASSIVILSERPLPGLEHLKKGRVPGIYSAGIQKLWEEQAKIVRLPPSDGELKVHEQFPYREIEDRIEGCKIFRLSATWFPQLHSWREKFLKALDAGAVVTMILSHPNSPFARMRAEAALGDPTLGRQEIIQNRDALRELRDQFDVESPQRNRQEASASTGKLTVKLTAQAIPLSYIEIDDTVYFSGFWSNRVSTRGFWLSTSSESPLGKFLADQFESIPAVNDDLEAHLAGSSAQVSQSPMLEELVHHTWVGTMTDVYCENSEKRQPEGIELTFQRSRDGLVTGRLKISREEEPKEMTLSLGNCAVRDNNLSFSCENMIHTAPHLGGLVLHVRRGEVADKWFGFYLGWSPGRSSHHCSKLEIRIQESGRSISTSSQL